MFNSDDVNKREASMENKNKFGASTETQQASIGPSVAVKGEISGEEDILIEGSVEGSINLQKNTVTVAETGKVKANIYGVVIHVFGQVTGDLSAGEKVFIHKTGRVVGNLTAPSISLEEGGRIKGMVDTDSAPNAARNAYSVEASASRDSGSSFAKTSGPKAASKAETASNGAILP